MSRRRAVLAALTIALTVSACAGSRQSTPIDTTAREMKVLQARAAHERGMAHAREGQPSAALTALQEAVSLDPDTALYANSLGVVLLQLRQLDGALAWLGKALQLDPNYGDAQLNYAIVLAEARRWDEAVDGYRKALRMPTLTAPHVAHQNLGVALYNLKRYGPAEESLRFAISLDPQMLGAYYNLGLVLAAGNRREEAKAAFRKARDLGPDSPFGQAAGDATKAVELGFPVFGCASTGNLAGSVAAHAARLGLPCYVFIPHDLEPNKVLGAAIYNPTVVAVEGNYDDVNRLCTQIADRYGWGFANINLRSYYAEGAKSMGFEIAEQLGWRYPDHIVSPVAGGTLLPRIYKGLREFKEVGLVDGQLPKIHAAQPSGSAPVVRALDAGDEFPDPVKPDTICKSLAIGNPADGFQVIKVVNETGGAGAMVTDAEILDGIQLLARTEGIFTEPAGGTTVAATRQLVQRGVIKSHESVVICVTGNGFKTAEVMQGHVQRPMTIGRSLADFERVVAPTVAMQPTPTA